MSGRYADGVITLALPRYVFEINKSVKVGAVRTAT